MNISNWKLVTKFLFGGGVSGVVEYVLEVLNEALSCMTDTTKTKVQAIMNVALKVLNVLNAVKWLVPTKWQTAYLLTVEAVGYAVDALKDLNVSMDDVKGIRERIDAAISAWNGPDDDTCVELKRVNGICVASR